MSALGPHSLNAACRAIYVQAAEGHILPRVLRDAADPEAPRRCLEAIGADFSILFSVIYDEPARGASGRVERPPLRFEIEARGLDDEAIEMDEPDRLELIRAFLLGVHEPVALEGPSESGEWRVALKVAPRFVMWTPMAERLDDGLSAAEISTRLAARLMDETGSLFWDRDTALDVWATRLREELFGEPRLTAHDLWPLATPDSVPPLPVLPLAANLDTPPGPRRAVRRGAVFAALALMGLSAMAGAVVTRGERTGSFAPVETRVIPSEPGAIGAEPRRLTAAPRLQQVAALEERAIWSPVATDTRFAVLAPAVAQATLALEPAALPDAQTARAVLPLVDAPLPPRRPRELAGGKRATAESRTPQKASAFARVDRAVSKFVKSIGAKLPRVKISALNSPHAAGPRRP